MKMDCGPGTSLAFVLLGLRGYCPNLVFKPMVVFFTLRHLNLWDPWAFPLLVEETCVRSGSLELLSKHPQSSPYKHCALPSSSNFVLYCQAASHPALLSSHLRHDDVIHKLLFL